MPPQVGRAWVEGMDAATASIGEGNGDHHDRDFIPHQVDGEWRLQRSGQEGDPVHNWP